MTHLDILRLSPWLRFVDKFGVSSRLLAATNGNAFIAFNTLHQTFELHSCESFMLTSSSCNASIDPEQVNGFILYDYKENELKRFVDDIKSEKALREHLRERHEANRYSTETAMASLKKVLGTTI